jgi:hypothetical protein
MNGTKKIGVLFVAVAMVFGPVLSASAGDEGKGAVFGAWAVSSDWGEHIIVLFPDSSGIIKDAMDGWSNELSDVKCEGNTVNLVWAHPQKVENEVVFEGTVEDDKIVGEYSSASAGMNTDVEGVVFSNDASGEDAEKMALVGHWELVTDWGAGAWDYSLVVFSDGTGILKDFEQEYTSEISDVNFSGNGTKFTFLFGGEGGTEVEFEGSITDGELEGEFHSEGKSAPVEGERN